MIGRAPVDPKVPVASRKLDYHITMSRRQCGRRHDQPAIRRSGEDSDSTLERIDIDLNLGSLALSGRVDLILDVARGWILAFQDTICRWSRDRRYMAVADTCLDYLAAIHAAATAVPIANWSRVHESGIWLFAFSSSTVPIGPTGWVFGSRTTSLPVFKR